MRAPPAKELHHGRILPGAIQIGGPAPRRLAEGLARAITDAGALAEAEAAPAMLQTAEDLLAAVDPTALAIRLYDDEASYSAFSTLEDWLREQRIPYDRQSAARYEYDGQAAFFRPGLGLIEHSATQDGALTMPIALLHPVRALLREALEDQGAPRPAQNQRLELAPNVPAHGECPFRGAAPPQLLITGCGGRPHRRC